jgi:uncharacterized protein YbaR (Trm112 family)
MSPPNLICPSCASEASLVVSTRAQVERTPVWDMKSARWVGVDDDDTRTVEHVDEQVLICLVCDRELALDDPHLPTT